jgi:2-hydroxy-3-oxopropionate reductase
VQIGFIGLGVMGAPMAANLIGAGHTVHLHRVKESTEHLVEAGGRRAGSAAAAAEAADVVILMLPDTPDVEEVLFGADGVAGALRPGALVIDMSSISPVATRSFAERITGDGGEYLDAPVSGGDVGARAGTLTILAGGTAAAFERAKPLLEVLGATITHVGDVGAGQTAKVANQIIVALTIQAVAEGLTFAEAAGVDPAVVREALMGGFASSRILEVHGQRMVDHSYDPGFRIRLHRKDLGLALGSARAMDLPLPHTASAHEFMNAAIAQGLGEADHSALHRVLGNAAGRAAK